MLPLGLALSLLGAALAADTSGGAGSERFGGEDAPDLRTILVGLVGDPPAPRDIPDLRALREALAATLGERTLREKWAGILPDSGLWTRLGPIVPWLFQQTRLRRGPEPTWPGVDAPLDVNLVWEWWTAEGRPDLGKTSWQKAVKHAQAWYRTRIAPMGYRAPVPPSRPIVLWDDGARIDHLVYAVDFDAEGLSMGHCLRCTLHYWDDQARGDIVIVSYRDPAGVPQATIELNREAPGHPVVVQLQGPHNGEIADALARPRLAWWLTEQVGLWADPQDPGAFTNQKTRRSDKGVLDAFWARRIGLAPERAHSEESPYARLQRHARYAEEEAWHALDDALHRTGDPALALSTAWWATVQLLDKVAQYDPNVRADVLAGGSRPSLRSGALDPRRRRVPFQTTTPARDLSLSLDVDVALHRAIWRVAEGQKALSEATNPLEALELASVVRPRDRIATPSLDVTGHLARGRRGATVRVPAADLLGLG